MKCIKSGNGLKWCPKCESILSFDEFRKNKNRKDGLNGWCKSCCADYQRSERKNGKVERERKYRLSKKGKHVTYKATAKYRTTKKYKQSWMKSNRKNRLSQSISARMRQSLHGCKYNKHWEDLVGYTIEDLKVHLEGQFEDGMTWKNHGKFGWHIDHIKPISSFNITDYNCDDFKICWALENLQPLWWMDNLRKGDKINEVR